MYAARLFVALVLAMTAVADECTTNDRGCGGGHPVKKDGNGIDAPDGSMYICNNGEWILSAECGGTKACHLDDDGPYCY